MPIRDKSIGWKMGRVWIPAQTLSGLDNNGTSTISFANGTPTWEPTAGASEIGAVLLDAADEVHHVLPIPWDMDRDQQVLGRIFFIHSSTDADAPVYKMTVKFMAKQDAVPELQGSPDVSVTFASHTCSTTNESLEVTKWTDLRWDDYITTTDILAGITIELDSLGSATADEIELLGVELAYTVEATTAYRMISNRDITLNPI